MNGGKLSAGKSTVDSFFLSTSSRCGVYTFLNYRKL